jgi:hypothetical protein
MNTNSPGSHFGFSSLHDLASISYANGKRNNRMLQWHWWEIWEAINYLLMLLERNIWRFCVMVLIAILEIVCDATPCRTHARTAGGPWKVSLEMFVFMIERGLDWHVLTFVYSLCSYTCSLFYVRPFNEYDLCRQSWRCNLLSYSTVTSETCPDLVWASIS